ncbi:MAG: hypothetical protein WAS33_26250, partial [Candidatus Promineifilaceae bacterium]
NKKRNTAFHKEEQSYTEKSGKICVICVPWLWHGEDTGRSTLWLQAKQKGSSGFRGVWRET